MHVSADEHPDYDNLRKLEPLSQGADGDCVLEGRSCLQLQPPEFGEYARI